MIELKFDEEVWTQIFTQLKLLYDKENTEMPKRKVTYKDEMQGMLKKYLEKNSELIAEVPSVSSEKEEVDVSRICEAYALPLNFTGKGSNLNLLTAHLRLLTNTDKQLIQEAYELEYKKATEILAFVLSDTDSMHDPEHQIRSVLPMV